MPGGGLVCSLTITTSNVLIKESSGSTPADRFFGAAPEVKRTLQERVAANALELARAGCGETAVLCDGPSGGKPFSVHAEGERMILTRAGEARQEVDLVAPTVGPAVSTAVASEVPLPVCPDGSPQCGMPYEGHEPEIPPGTSPLDGASFDVGNTFPDPAGGAS